MNSTSHEDVLFLWSVGFWSEAKQALSDLICFPQVRPVLFIAITLGEQKPLWDVTDEGLISHEKAWSSRRSV